MNQRGVWDSIAESWNSFRQRPFYDFSDVIRRINLRKRSKILDVGCGNGRNLLPFKGHDLYGLDFSREMLMFAKKFSDKHDLNIKLVQGDARSLPFKSNTFDLILSIAVLHHLRNPLIALMEIHRVLKPGGTLVASVWNKWQSRFLVDSILRRREVFVPWRTGNVVYKRYYRLLSKKDLKQLLRMAGFLRFEIFPGTKKGLFYQNIFVISNK